MITNTINKQLQTALLLSAMGLGLLGCQDVDLLEDFAPMPTQAADTTLTAPSHHIPRNAALASLEAFLQNDTHGAKSRRRIGRVSGITPVQPGAKASSPLADLGCDTLLYLVGFEHEQGYALLAADDRIGSDILAVTDNGSLSERDVHCAIEALKPSAGIQPNPDYPTTGPGIVYDDDGNAYMNPNTFDPYDAELDDYMIGNFDNSDEDEAAGGFVRAREHDGVQALMTTMVVRYAMEEIMGSREERPIRNELIRIPDDGDGGGGGGGHVGDFSSWTTYDSRTRYDEKKVNPMFNADNTHNWHQNSPFNSYCPMVRKAVLFGKKKQAACGCVPIAIGRIMAHFNFPGTVAYNGIVVDWNALKNNYSSSVGAQSAAALMRALGLSMHTIYFYNGAFTFPKYAAKYLEKIYYRNVKYTDYNTETVCSALDNGCPVFICAMPKEGIIPNITKSHAWNIDGYKIKHVDTYKEYYKNGIKEKEEYVGTTTTVLIHCDFGWSGSDHGYFASGIFNSSSSEAEWHGDYKFNYNIYLKTITYDNPNK